MKRAGFCYVDSSALIKCYVSEQGSRAMQAQRLRWQGLFTSLLSLAECLAATQRLRREGVLSRRESQHVVSMLRADLEAMYVVDVNDTVLKRAPEWAEREPLRGADLVHAATALWLCDQGILKTFIVSDRRLGNAMTALGLEVWDPVKSEGEADT